MSLSWRSPAPGVFSAMIGEEGFVTLVPPAPRADMVQAIEQVAADVTGDEGHGFPLAAADITVRRVGNRWVLSLPIDETEKLYGVGLNYDTLDQRECVRELKVDHYGMHDNGSSHAPVPFYVSQRGYGVFVNVAERIKVYVGTTHPRTRPHPPMYDRVTDSRWRGVSISRRVEISIPGKGAQVVIFAGPTMLKAVRRFNLFCGGGCLPPRWGLGFWHRVPLDYSAERTLAEAAEFQKNDYPLDVIGLEPGWHSASYPTTYEFSPVRFPDPKAFMGQMARIGLRVNLWENCMIHPDSPLGKAVASRSGDYFAGWGGLIADLADPQAREIVGEQHDRVHLAAGASGYKLDECDGLDQWVWPDHAQFPSGLTAVQLRQQYGLLFQKLTTELFAARNLRTYGLVRASNAGGAQYPYVIYNDCYEHRQYITGMINGGFIGVLFTPEVRGAQTAGEWLRRIQAVCMSPMAMINAWSMQVLPWSFPEVAEQVRDAMKLRMRLLPYLYSAFGRYLHEGIPPFRALALEGCLPQADETYEQGKLDSVANPYMKAICRDIRDQYIMGDSIMVAPLFDGEAKRDIVIPAGKWYDFYTGKFVGENTVITVNGNQTDIPMFVREGGIVPMLAEAIPHAPAPGAEMVLEVRHYGKDGGEFQLYDDDGETMEYTKGNFCHVPLTVKRSPDGMLEGVVGKSIGRYQSTCRVGSWRFMTVPS